jgi:hypothetical protein
VGVSSPYIPRYGPSGPGDFEEEGGSTHDFDARVDARREHHAQNRRETQGFFVVPQRGGVPGDGRLHEQLRPFAEPMTGTREVLWTDDLHDLVSLLRWE